MFLAVVRTKNCAFNACISPTTKTGEAFLVVPSKILSCQKPIDHRSREVASATRFSGVHDAPSGPIYRGGPRTRLYFPRQMWLGKWAASDWSPLPPRGYEKDKLRGKPLPLASNSCKMVDDLPVFPILLSILPLLLGLLWVSGTFRRVCDISPTDQTSGSNGRVWPPTELAPANGEEVWEVPQSIGELRISKLFIHPIKVSA